MKTVSMTYDPNQIHVCLVKFWKCTAPTKTKTIACEVRFLCVCVWNCGVETDTHDWRARKCARGTKMTRKKTTRPKKSNKKIVNTNSGSKTTTKQRSKKQNKVIEHSNLYTYSMCIRCNHVRFHSHSLARSKTITIRQETIFMFVCALICWTRSTRVEKCDVFNLFVYLLLSHDYWMCVCVCVWAMCV